MEVVSLLQCPAAAFRWRFGSGGHRVTVVTKATYDLRPLKAELSTASAVPIASKDEHHDADPAKSLRAISDLAPYKLRPEVLVVGSAYAPEGRAVRSLLVRAVVGEMEKQVEVLADRSINIQGALREGPMFQRMPLVYERAAGGRDTWNPSGMDPNVRDSSGVLRLPNIVPAGTPFQAVDIAPIGLGPVAPQWPLRSELLRNHAATWRHGVYGGDLVVPDDLDLRYFNAAPSDQQLDGPIPGGLHLILEHLHPSGSRLSTYLPEIRPNVVATIGARRETVPMLPDTVLVDTDASRCTITFRAVLVLESANQQLGLAIIDGSGSLAEALRTSELLVDPLTPAVDVTQVGNLAPEKPTLPFESAGAPPPSRARGPLQSGLPFSNQAAPGPAVPPPPPSAPGPSTAPPSRPLAVLGGQLRPPSRVPPPPPPASVASGSVAPPGPHPPAPVPPPVQVPTAVQIPSAVQVPTAVQIPSRVDVPVPAKVPVSGVSAASVSAGTSASSAQLPPQPAAARALPQTPGSGAGIYGLVPERPSYLHAETPRRPEGAPASVAHSQSAAREGALAASDAAAGMQAQPARAKGSLEPRSVAETSPAQPVEKDVVEILWAADEVVEEAKRSRALKHLFSTGKERRAMLAADDRATDEETKKQRELIRILGSGLPVNDVKALESIVHDVIEEAGAVIPPLVVVSGELAVKLSQRMLLEALIGIVRPLAGTDRGIQEAIDNAQTFSGNEWSQPRSMENAFNRLRDTAARGQRELPAIQLQASAERMVLERRTFETRTLFGAEHVRADITLGNQQVPMYLPMDVKDRLPLFDRFPCRAAVEVRPKHDAHEASPLALVVRAIGRKHTRR